MSKPARPYRSPSRDQQALDTRRRIMAAASEQFLASGYTATTVRAIAATAGVSVATVELVFGTKPQLLKAVIDVAIAGDDEPVPVLQRAWAARAQAATTVADFLAIVGDVLREAEVRSAGLVVAAFEARATDPTITALTDQLAKQRATTAAWIVDGVTERSTLREELSRQAAIDTIWMLMDPVVFLRLTRDRGWSAERFETWFTDSIPRLLLSSPEDAGRAHGPPVRAKRGRLPARRERGKTS
jgi:AcrR family transcriptional regulator